MANFIEAYTNTRGHEGGWVVDHYSQTYQGITRKGWPVWSGWVLIDRWIRANGQPRRGMYFNIPGLEKMVMAFYKLNYWDRMYGDFIKNQTLANFIYDFYVNSNAALFIINNALGARASNFLNEDSLKIINMRPAFAYEAIRSARKKHYVKQAQQPKKKKYLDGWLSRLDSFPKSIAA